MNHFAQCLGAVCLGAIVLLSACSRASSADASTVQCAEPLPAFSLAPTATLSRQQQPALCSCIWSKLEANERQVAEKIVEHRESALSSIELRAFPSRFGNALESCSGTASPLSAPP